MKDGRIKTEDGRFRLCRTKNKDVRFKIKDFTEQREKIKDKRPC